MALIPVASFTLDTDTYEFAWAPMNGGDYGTPIQAWGYPHMTFQFSGTGGDSNYPPSFPPTPMSPDRSITVYGSLDGSCWCPIITLGYNANISDQLHDPYFYMDNHTPRFKWLMPVAGGAVTKIGDCGLILMTYRLFGPR